AEIEVKTLDPCLLQNLTPREARKVFTSGQTALRSCAVWMSRAMLSGLEAAPASSAIGFSTAPIKVASAATTCGAALSALLAPESHLRASSAAISIPFSMFTRMFAMAMFPSFGRLREPVQICDDLVPGAVVAVLQSRIV